MIMINYVSDDISNKIYRLTKALNEAQQIIRKLSEENENLKDTLSYISVPETEDENYSSELSEIH